MTTHNINTIIKTNLENLVREPARHLPRWTSLFAGVAVAGLLLGCDATHANLQKQAKLPQADAERIALTQAPGGTVKSAELEKEKGKLVWSFDIATPGSPDITEVLVNAMDGSVVSVEKETPAQQAREKDADAKVKKGKKGEKEEDDEKDEK
jgi:hypothetical protein